MKYIKLFEMEKTNFGNIKIYKKFSPLIKDLNEKLNFIGINIDHDCSTESLKDRINDEHYLVVDMNLNSINGSVLQIFLKYIARNFYNMMSKYNGNDQRYLNYKKLYFVDSDSIGSNLRKLKIKLNIDDTLENNYSNIIDNLSNCLNEAVKTGNYAICMDSINNMRDQYISIVIEMYLQFINDNNIIYKFILSHEFINIIKQMMKMRGGLLKYTHEIIGDLNKYRPELLNKLDFDEESKDMGVMGF